MDDDILTVDEAAGLLKTEPATVVSLLDSNEIPGRQIAGSWRTTKRALVSYVDGVPLQVACCTPSGCVPTSEEEAMAGGQGAGGCCC